MMLFRKFAYITAGMLFAITALGVFLPATAHVQRQIEINAPAASIFALVNDFKQVNKWSPWVAIDPNALYTISGPPRGVGATVAWDGQIVGRGSQVIIESRPYDRVVSRLEPNNQGKAISTFELEQTVAGTRVTWNFDNDAGLNLIGRYLGLLLDGIVGPEYEKGLDNLKTMAENLPPADFSDLEIEHRNVAALNIVYLQTTSVPEAAAISTALGDAYFELLNFIDKHGLLESGAPMSISGTFTGTELQFDAAIPVHNLAKDTPRNDQGVQIGHTYTGRVIRAKHVGSYRDLGRTHDKIAAYLAALGIERNGSMWESYVSDPTRVNEEELLTYVYYPISAE